MNEPKILHLHTRKLKTGPFPNSLFSGHKPAFHQIKQPWHELLNLKATHTVPVSSRKYQLKYAHCLKKRTSLGFM